jgi:two-component system NtrC family sensor kinase
MRKGIMRGGAERGGAEPASGPASAPADVPSSDREVSASRARLLDVVPIAWLDQLLIAVPDLPMAGGELAVVDALVQSIAAILPSYAVGASFVGEAEADEGGRRFVTRLPEELEGRAGDPDSSRLFPGLSYEHVVLVPGSAGESTLHLGADDHELDPDGSPAVHLVERAATVLGRALPGARATAAALALAQRTASVFEQRMIHADKLATFGQVAAGVVHELNNPLTSIVAYSDYLIRKSVDSGSRDVEDIERLRRISESANRMLRFTRELVSYARPSGGAAEQVVLHSVIDRAIAFCEHVLAAAGMRVERAYAPDVLTMLAVSEQLVQVFVNLITNACQAAPPEGGRLIVETSLATGPDGRRTVVVSIVDNGSGIAVEHLTRVFAPFFTTKGDKNGTGLGLSIVKSIVEGHAGSIRVDSQIGHGTRFVIEIPLQADVA